ncbi:MAG: M16 family metallopeptidase, partial [Chitinophagaceae bacterium]
MREKHGYTYGAYSSVSNDPVVSNFSASAAVRTTVTDSSLMRFMYELNRIRDEKVDEKKLNSVKNQMSGNFALSLERPARIAQFALNIARYNMPNDYYKNYLKSIAAVTPEDVQRVAQKYITPEQPHIVLVGNSKEFAGQLQQFGSVQYVDMYGNSVAAPERKEIPAAVTAEGVIKNYLKAIGGEEKIKSVQDVSIKATATAMGQEIALQQLYLLKDKYKMTLTLPSQNMTVVKILVNGDSVSMEQMGQPVPVTREKEADIKSQANPFQEINFLNGKYTLKLKGIEPVNGADAYALDVTNEEGKTTTYYFDTKTGFEVRTVSSEKTPQGEVSSIKDMSNYKLMDGI